jgi:hypothetical protein
MLAEHKEGTLIRPRGQAMRSWLISFAAIVAAAAVLASNIDNILTITSKWLGPHLAPYIYPQAHIAIRLDDETATTADVFVSDPADNVLAHGRTRHGEEAVLTVPANVLYKIGWQGPNILAGAVAGVFAAQGSSAFRLVRNGEDQGVVKVTLRPTDADTTPFAATEPSAKLLISARVASVASEPAAVIGASALPELDRAVAIVGLFETGTTDCARRVFYTPAFGAARGGDAKAPSVGCLGMSIPGWLADVIAAVDGGDARRLDAVLGDDATAIRAYAKDAHALPPAAQLQRASERLVAAPEFWVAYQSRVLAAYASAAEVARQVGLVSERGRLLVFDHLVQFGPNAVARVARTYTERYPETAQDRPGTERDRIRALGDIFKTQPTIPAFLARAVSRRVDTIVSGQGSIRGISFNLGQLGISDAG